MNKIEKIIIIIKISIIMKIVLSNQKKVAQFACILRHLKNLSSDIEWSISAEQFYTQGMDSSHACLFELQLNPEWFDVYDVKKKCMLGINCELIFKIFNCLGENQKVEIEYEETKDNLCISLLPIEGEKGIEKIFELPLINMEVDMLEVPDTEWSADIEMLSSEFSQLIDQLSIFGNDLAIKCNDEITLTGSGEHGKMNARIKNDDILLYAIEEDSEIIVNYSMVFIKEMASYSKLNKKVSIGVSINIPIKIQYDLDDFMDDEDDNDEEYISKNFIRFFLAPKIEDF
jgi:proliferating cell nuclear antigen PCNA